MSALYYLSEELRSQVFGESAPSHVRAFCAWLLDDNSGLIALVREAAASGQQRRPEHVAVLGYANAAGLLPEADVLLLRDDLAQLSGRSYFPGGRPLRFEIDGIALLGVVLGLKGQALDSVWMKQLLNKSSTVLDDGWNLSLVAAAQIVLGDISVVIRSMDLTVAMASKGIGVLPADLEAAWNAAIMLQRPETPDRAAAKLLALQDLSMRSAQIVPRAANRADVVAILEGTARSLKRWPYGDKTPRSQPALWEIANEYNVQDLLWAMLAPIFPDLEDEEALPSLGPKHPRADLGLPKLRTIIEVKYLRRDRQGDRARLIEEVAADASLYLSKTHDYDGIIAYVWDDAAQSDQHHEIKMGLETIPGIVAAVIIARPAKMMKPVTQ